MCPTAVLLQRIAPEIKPNKTTNHCITATRQHSTTIPLPKDTQTQSGFKTLTGLIRLLAHIFKRKFGLFLETFNQFCFKGESGKFVKNVKMGKYEKLIEKILIGKSDQNIEFKDLIYLLLNFGFEQRIKGSHHIFYKEGIEEIINLQPKGNKAKAYQVKQIRNIIVNYKLELKATDHE